MSRDRAHREGSCGSSSLRACWGTEVRRIPILLPAVYAITNAGADGAGKFMRSLERALNGGVRLIQVREHAMPSTQFTGFAREVIERAHGHGAIVLVNNDESLALDVGADGVHLTSARLMALDRPPGIGLWAASCHGASELAQAARLGADFAVLSPVLPTASHPGEPGMGWNVFEAQVRDCPLPVYALGGMREELLDVARQHGAHGIALRSGIW